jgi:menaquinone-dependent protoporphyrinogen oxidase
VKISPQRGESPQKFTTWGGKRYLPHTCGDSKTIAGNKFTSSEINLRENQYKGANDMRKVLVAYASKAGSTGEVAEAMGQVLNAKGMTVDVRQVKNVKDVSGYQAFVIGSAIRMGRWLPEAVQFVEKNRDVLSRALTAYFLVSGFLREDTPEMRSQVLTFVDPVRKILEPKSIGLFAGKMDYSKISWLDRTIAQAVKSVEGDWRNWDAIRGWAGELATRLSA